MKEMLIINDYYSFGIPMPNRNIQDASGSSYYKDTEAVWYKFERVNNPTTFLGIKLWDNYSVKKTQISKGTDLDLTKQMETQTNE